MSIEYPIRYIHSDKNEMITNKLPEKLKVFAYGSGFNLLGQSFFWNKDSVQIDISDIDKQTDGSILLTTNTLNDEISEQLGSNISVQSIFPERIKIQLEKLQQKKVKVILNSKLSFAPQSKLKDSILISPAYVTVFAPKSYLDSLKEIPTELLEREDIDENFSTTLNIKRDNKNNYVYYQPSQVELKAEVVQFTESTIELEIKVDNRNSATNELKNGLRLIPSKVNVKFLVPLDKYDKINADLFNASINFDDISENTEKLKVSVNTNADYIEIIKIQPEKVEYLIKK